MKTGWPMPGTLAALDYYRNRLTPEDIKPGHFSLFLISSYYRLGEKAPARQMAAELLEVPWRKLASP